MSPPSSLGRPTGWLLLLTTTGCAALGIGKREDGDAAAAGQGEPADTLARADSGAVPAPAAAAGADSAVSLRDSVLAVLEARRAADDTAGGGEPGRPPPREKDAPPAAGRDGGPSGAVRVADVDSLEALGPVYTPYDVPPLLREEGLEGLLRATILPVIQRHGLEPDAWARFWVLVTAGGRVVDHVLHLTSGHAAFDDAAAAAAEQLRYRPARRDGERVPVWVLVRISLLMG